MSDTIEGRNPVLEALRAGRTISRILIARNIEKSGTINEILSLIKEKNIPVEYLEKDELSHVSRTGSYQGIVALIPQRQYFDLAEILSIPQKKQEPAFFVVLDGIEDPHNLGAIIRTGEATGVHGVIIREKRAVGLTAGVEKASAGALEYVAVARVNNISRALERLKKQNIWIIGVDQSGDIEYTGIDLKPPSAIVIGSEGGGISNLVKRKCDFLVKIPMIGKITSLNASVAAALVMYEVFRQRRNKVSD